MSMWSITVIENWASANCGCAGRQIVMRERHRLLETPDNVLRAGCGLDCVESSHAGFWIILGIEPQDLFPSN